MTSELIPWLETRCSELKLEPGEDAGYALPKASLRLLESLVGHLGIERVFEFGSGRSTETFLRLGCQVRSIEDSGEWLEKTRQSLMSVGLERASWSPSLLPLQGRWDAGVPFRSWLLNETLQKELAAAELVLIDSPAHPPSREMALLDTLRSGNRGIVLLDDAGIPTLTRFCERIRQSNPTVQGMRLDLDHGLYVFDLRQRGSTLCLSRGIVESLKAWRRYSQASKQMPPETVA